MPVEVVDLEELHLDLLNAPARPDRPHVALNFVLTADGRASYRGRAEIGTRTDRELMAHLRSLADAVMVGAGTLRVDPFAPQVRKDRQFDRRTAARKTRQPLAVVVSRAAKLPLENRFFSIPNPRLVITTGRAADADVAEIERTGTDVLRIGEDEADLPRALAVLRAEHSIGFLLCEGGPLLAGQLLAGSLIDEVFLTHATLVTAEPDARRLFELDRPLAREVRFERVALYESVEGERYERAHVRYS